MARMFDKLNCNCTLSEFARQLNIPVWKAIEMVKYAHEIRPVNKKPKPEEK
jgi:hypothetical protein